MENMISELIHTGHKLIEEKKIQIVICYLPSSWDQMKHHLMHASNIQTFDDATQYLELKKDHLTALKITIEAYVATYGPQNGPSSKENRIQRYSSLRTKEKGQTETKRAAKESKSHISKMKCYNYQQKWHIAKDCIAPK